MNFFQLVKTNPHLPLFPNNSQMYLSVPSRSKRRIVLSVRVSQSVLLEDAAVHMSLKSVCWKESLTSSSSKMDTSENYFSSQSSKNLPFQTAPQTGASPQRKPPQMGSLLVMGKFMPSTFVPRLEAAPKLPTVSASVRGYAPSLPATILLFWLRSLLVRGAPSTCEGAEHWSNCARDSRSVIEALTIRDRKIKRLWLHGERAVPTKSPPSPEICARFPLCCSR